MNARDRAIRDGYVEFLKSRRFDPYFRKMVPEPKWRYLLAIPLILTVVGLPIGLGLVSSARRDVRKRNQLREELIAVSRRSVPLIVYPVMANTMLMSRKGMTAPALVIGTFEEATTGEMVGIAERMMTGDGLGPEAQQAVAGMFADEEYTSGRRRVLPEELTGSRPVYAFDLVVRNDYLKSDTLEQPLIPCVAEPGDSGSIQMIPWWVVDGAAKGA